MDNTIIRVNNVSKTFKIGKPKSILRVGKKLVNQKILKTISALEGVSFEVQKGDVLGLVGLNGSGKSTLLRIISGIYSPDKGSVKVNGTLSPLMQLGAGFQGELNAYENILMNGMLLGLPKSEIKKLVPKIMNYAELEKFSELKINHYSTGMRARLAFSIAMQINPDILLIDEILSVGDIEFQKKSYDSILSLKKNKKTIIHATHNLTKLQEISDKAILLHKGKKVMLGKPDEVIKKYKEIITEEKNKN